MPQNKTNLVISISAPKSGTTALFHCLARCADVANPKIKEPCYFSPKSGPKHLGIPRRLDLDGRHHLGPQWFDGLYLRDQRLRLDFSTFYSATPNTPQLVYQHDPQARLIFVLRDPVKRFLSHYYHYRKTGISLPPLCQVIKKESGLRQYLLLFADYENTYQRYTDWFPLDQISILRFEDMVSDPSLTEAEIRAFLDIPDFKFDPNSKEKNSAGRPKSLFFQQILLGRHMAHLSALAPHSPEYLLKLRRRLVAWNTSPTKNPPLDAGLERRLRDLLAPQYEFLDALFPKSEVANAA